MNHFLALRLDDAPRDRLATLAERFRSWDLPARWVHPDDYHLTLLFLGGLDADEERSVPYAIDDMARTLVAPTLRLAGLGAFGGRTEPRVVYAACTDAQGDCASAHRGLAECMDLPATAAFQPHVTLCRPTTAAPGHRSRGDWYRFLEANGQAEWGPCPTTHLVLYRSTDRRPRYEAVASWELCRPGEDRTARSA
mgnify:CR=1 FL=1